MMDFLSAQKLKDLRGLLIFLLFLLVPLLLSSKGSTLDKKGIDNDTRHLMREKYARKLDFDRLQRKKKSQERESLLLQEINAMRLKKEKARLEMEKHQRIFAEQHRRLIARREALELSGILERRTQLESLKEQRLQELNRQKFVQRRDYQKRMLNKVPGVNEAIEYDLTDKNQSW